MTLTTVALRYHALYLPIKPEEIDLKSEPTAPVLAFVRRLRENGFCLEESLLHALNAVSADTLAGITQCINEVMGVTLNWAPLVKGWDVPTGETMADHLVTMIANIFGEDAGFRGERLPCGHLIPNGTFPLERYNGCPFCGTPFRTTDYVFRGQGSKLKELRLFTDDDMQQVFLSLLESSTPLDSTQKESLSQLLTVYDVPESSRITMKETTMFVIRSLIGKKRDEDATRYLKTPTDVLRYLWFEKTGYVQIIEPKVLIAHAKRLNMHMWLAADQSAEAAAVMKNNLKLKYDRKTCRRVASWLNATPMSAHQAAENMNPKRGMWVRMIRALRLGEYARRKGFEHLAEIIDVFYKQNYTTWQGHVDKARNNNDATTVFGLLRQRPGLFARCLFSTILRFGTEKTLAAFSEVADELPARLLLSLGNAAEIYFDNRQERFARPIIGGTKQIMPNKLLDLYSDDERKAMADAVMDIYKASMRMRFAQLATSHKTMYIDPALFHIPVGVGDRSTTIQDLSCALMGTRFAVEGDAVRLFMQWGKGLPAQHLDMDLSCRIILPHRTEECAYYNLTCTGAKHSGDIRSIPEMVGTAEYIELSLPELEEAKATHVVFTCNAYSTGALSPNLMVGWMSSAYPMELSEEDGVAYDPSCVQHMVRISEGDLSKGLVFGVLDVAKREIVWLEMPLSGQTLRDVNSGAVMTLLERLDKKLSVGELLRMKAEAQHLTLAETADEADESYTYQWALNLAEVSRLLASEKSGEA